MEPVVGDVCIEFSALIRLPNIGFPIQSRWIEMMFDIDLRHCKYAIPGLPDLNG